MRKLAIVIFICLMFILGFLIWTRFSTGEDSWICSNGQWIKHGNPSAPMPTSGCGISQDQNKVPEKPAQDQSQMVRVDFPKADEVISSPLEISGRARGNWYFEATFPVKLIDVNGNILATGNAQAQGEWTTEDFVPFISKLEFSSATSTNGFLVLEKDNPSGLPENAAEIRVPVIIKETKKTAVKVFFGNSKIDPNVEECNKVYPVTRMITPTEAVARASLEELLKGITDEEKSQGFFTTINPGVTIKSLNIENGIADVDFDEKLGEGVGGSCKVAAIRAQISETLKQFDTVKEVVISINGRTEDILQP